MLTYYQNANLEEFLLAKGRFHIKILTPSIGDSLLHWILYN